MVELNSQSIEGFVSAVALLRQIGSNGQTVAGLSNSERLSFDLDSAERQNPIVRGIMLHHAFEAQYRGQGLLNNFTLIAVSQDGRARLVLGQRGFRVIQDKKELEADSQTLNNFEVTFSSIIDRVREVVLEKFA